MHSRVERTLSLPTLALVVLLVITGLVPISAAHAAGPTPTPTLTPTPAASPGPSVLYEDDFSDPQSGWPQGTFAHSTKGYEQGHYFIRIDEDQWSSWALGPATVFGDVSAEVDAQAAAAPGSGHNYGLIFRYQDSDNFYYLLVDGAGRYQLGKQVAGKFQSLGAKDWTPDAAIKTDTASNHLKLAGEGTLISAYANGELLTSVNDSSFAKGQVALTAESYDNPQPGFKVDFDNFVVRQAAEPVRPTPAPTPAPLFSDDFWDPSSGWPDTSDSVATVGYDLGEYTISVDVENHASWVTQEAGDSYGDFAVEVDADQVFSRDTGRYGLVFRHQDEDNFYYFMLDGQGRYRVAKRVDGKWQAVEDTDWATDPAVKPGVSNHLKVIAVGPQIAVYANGVQLASLHDDSIARGKIGMIAETIPGLSSTMATFSDLVVNSARAVPATALPATPTPTEVARPATLFRDDFSDPASGWSRKSDEDGAKDYENGAYTIRLDNESLASWTGAPTEDYADAIVEVDGEQISGADDARFGLIFRRQDNDNFYYYEIDRQGQYRVGKQAGGQWQAVAGTGWTASPAITTTGTNHLKIVTAGSQINAYANDVLLISLNDDTIAKGRPGLMIETTKGSKPVKVAFDNFVVSRVVPPPTPTPRPAATSQLLYRDDFTDPNSGWQRWSGAKGTQDYLNGEYVIHLDQPSSLLWAFGSNEQFGDSTIEVDAHKVTGADAARWGLIFRKQDIDNFYYFYIDGQGDYLVGVREKGQYRQLGNGRWNESPAIQKGSASNRLKVVTRGSQIGLYANGELLTTLQDDTLAQGQAGLLVQKDDGKDPAEVAFGNFVVTNSAAATAEATPAATAESQTVPSSPTPTPTRGPTVLYTDDFSDPGTGWPRSSSKSSQKSYVSGEYVFSVLEPDTTSWVWGPDQSFDDFALAIDARRISGPDTARSGVIFRFQDHDNFYYYLVDATGRYQVGKLEKGKWHTLTSPDWVSDPAIKTAGETNRLKVLANGSAIQVFANDTLLGTFDDESFAGGKIGVMAESASGSDPIKVGFANLLVTKPE